MHHCHEVSTEKTSVFGNRFAFFQSSELNHPFKQVVQNFSKSREVGVYQGGLECANLRTGFIDSKGSRR